MRCSSIANGPWNYLTGKRRWAKDTRFTLSSERQGTARFREAANVNQSFRGYRFSSELRYCESTLLVTELASRTRQAAGVTLGFAIWYQPA
jgi:hypothetical protein